MIAMQYTFVLPAQFDMKTIHQRVAENGAKLNGFNNLGFKAYLIQEKNNDDAYQRENRYAPFYFWNSSEGMTSFITTSGYKNLEEDFGRPNVCTYLPFVHKQNKNLKDTQYACVSKEAISRDISIQTLHEQKKAFIDQFFHPDMTAYITALDTQNWQLHTWLFFSSTVELQELTMFNRNAELSAYQVGYVAE